MAAQYCHSDPENHGGTVTMSNREEHAYCFRPETSYILTESHWWLWGVPGAPVPTTLHFSIYHSTALGVPIGAAIATASIAFIGTRDFPPTEHIVPWDNIFLEEGAYYSQSVYCEPLDQAYWTTGFTPHMGVNAICRVAYPPNPVHICRSYRHYDGGWGGWTTGFVVDLHYSHGGVLPVAPTVVTNPATDIEEETATLNGEITDVGVEDADERGFDWGLDISYGNSWTESNSYGVAAFSHAISGLSPGTTIHFRAKAHSAGWGYGDDLTFVTKPEACTNMVATVISDTQIDVSWTKGDGAGNTVVRRKVGAYPANLADGDEAYNGSSASFSDQGLDPSTAYYYRGWCYTDPHYADAYCQDNATTQAVPPFPLPPTVTTESANNINQTLATVNGVLANDGGEACDCWFEYAEVGDTIYTTAVQGGKTTGALFSADLTGLTHNTRYHFRAIAGNSTGITYGANMYFVTESPALLEYSLLEPELAELLT